MIKKTLRNISPVLYQRLYSTKEYLRLQAKTEYKVLRQMVRNRGAWKPAVPWNEVLPMQKPQRFTIVDVAGANMTALAADLDAKGLTYSRDADSVYLPPETLRAAPFDVVAKSYPAGVGLRIVTEPAATATAVESGGRKSQLSRTGELGLIANLLYESKLGPRLYDVVQLDCREAVWTAYVFEHAGSWIPDAMCDDAAGRISEFEHDQILRLAQADDGHQNGCHSTSSNGYTRTDNDEIRRYCSFQNFTLHKYGRYLRRLGAKSANDAHFGGESLLRHGRFLYQAVPGVQLPAKRSTADRIILIDQLMASAGFNVNGRLVLDIGCNTGMMMAEYLKRGASWCHGWDRAAVIPHTESLLLAIGCTRFSTTSAIIAKERRLEEDVPEFARSMLPGCVISYLAVRLHLGWLDALATIPWSYLIYEGHQYETRDHFDAHMAQLRELVDVRVLNIGTYKEGFSNERIVAMLAKVQ